MFTLNKHISKKVPGEYLEYIEKKDASGDKLPLVIYIHGVGGLGVKTEDLNYFI